MVRFIINNKSLKENTDKNLHSNMVRFIIFRKKRKVAKEKKFTFQYG